MSTSNLVVIGSLNMDITARVSRLPVPGETILGSDVYQAPGGKGGNQAVAAARLGATVQMVARVGADAFGSTLREGLISEGVGVASVFTAAAPTGTALILVEDAGQNQIAVVPGANALLGETDLADVVWAPGAWAVAQLEVPQDVVIKGFQLAHNAGCRTLLNAAPALALKPELARLTDILVVNESEAEALSDQPVQGPTDALSAARSLSRTGPAIVAVTLGKNGSLLMDREKAWYLPAIQVEAIDATAAGDAWVGALATALASGAELLEAATFATAAGALTATRSGAQPALPRRDEVEALARTAPTPQPLV